HGAEHIEERPDAQVLPDGPYCLEGRMEQGGMKEADTGFVDLPSQFVLIVLEPIAELFHDVGGAADRRGAVVTVFGDLMTRACDDKAGEGRDIECILAVAAGAYDIDGLEPVQVDA